MNGTRPVFGYNATGLQDITEVSATLYVDVNPGKPPTETVLQSAVYLRNQNRKPTALFSVDVVNTAIILNASESTDPEEKADELRVEDRRSRSRSRATLPGSC